MNGLPTVKAIRDLLKYTEKQRDNTNPLVCVAYWTNIPEAVDALVEAGADVNQTSEYGKTPLMFAASHNPVPEITRRFIKLGANVNARDARGRTPVLYAAQSNCNPTVLQELLEAGADADATDSEGHGVLDMARGNENAEVLDMLKRLSMSGKQVERPQALTNNDIVPGFDDMQDDACPVRLQKVGDVLLMYLTGYVDTYNSHMFVERGSKAIDAGFNKVVLDGAQLSYMSSTAIGAVVTLFKAARSGGGDLVLSRLQPKVYEVLKLLGFAKFFKITESIDAAIEVFEARGERPLTPQKIKCPVCEAKLRFKVGRFRCPDCRTVIEVDDTGAVYI